ncbi:MAG: hypothetical protein JRC57_06370 [Deltaproteobacteria bacterium]|nr:hypothetical protein [Deltaproteobacteria bacterium]
MQPRRKKGTYLLPSLKLARYTIMHPSIKTVDGSTTTAAAAEKPEKSAMLFFLWGSSRLICITSTNERKEKNAAGR